MQAISKMSTGLLLLLVVVLLLVLTGCTSTETAECLSSRDCPNARPICVREHCVASDGSMQQDAHSSDAHPTAPDVAVADANVDGSSPDTGSDAAAWDAKADGPAPDARTDGAPPDARTDGAPPDARTDSAPPDAGTDGAPPDAGIDGAPPDARAAEAGGAPPDSAIDSAPNDARPDSARADAGSVNELRLRTGRFVWTSGQLGSGRIFAPDEICDPARTLCIRGQLRLGAHQ